MLNTSIVSVFCFYGPRFQKERITMFGKQSVSGELQVNKESTLFSNLACYFVIVKWGRNNLACRPGVIFWHIAGDCKGKGEARGQCGVQVTCGGIRMQKKNKNSCTHTIVCTLPPPVTFPITNQSQYLIKIYI